MSTRLRSLVEHGRLYFFNLYFINLCIFSLCDFHLSDRCDYLPSVLLSFWAGRGNMKGIQPAKSHECWSAGRDELKWSCVQCEFYLMPSLPPSSVTVVKPCSGTGFLDCRGILYWPLVECCCSPWCICSLVMDRS